MSVRYYQIKNFTVTELSVADVTQIFQENRLRLNDHASLHEYYRPLRRSDESFINAMNSHHVISAMMRSTRGTDVDFSVHAVADSHDEADPIFASWVDVLSRSEQNRISIAVKAEAHLALLRSMKST